MKLVKHIACTLDGFRYLSFEIHDLYSFYFFGHKLIILHSDIQLNLMDTFFTDMLENFKCIGMYVLLM